MKYYFQLLKPVCKLQNKKRRTELPYSANTDHVAVLTACVFFLWGQASVFHFVE
jgi:hypothetical protein